MATIKKEIKLFIVQQFALFASSGEIIDLVKDEFDVVVTKQQIHFYNGDRNEKLPEEWRKIFNKTRTEFEEGKLKIPIAEKHYRLNELNKIYQKQKSAKSQNTKAMKDTLEQAAKESGDAFSNRIKHDVDATVQHSVVRVPPKLTPEQWNQQSEQSNQQPKEA